MKNIYYEIIREDNKLPVLKEEWNELIDHSETKSPFLTFEWITNWWTCFGTGNQLFVITLRSNNELVGIVPLMKARKYLSNVLMFIGTGRSDYLDFIFKNGFDKGTLWEGLITCLKEHAKEWDIINLRDMNWPEDRIPDLVPYFNRSDLGVYYHIDTVCPYLTIENKWEDYLDTKSTKHKQNIRRLEKVVSKAGQITLSMVGKEDLMETVLRDISRIEKHSWKMDVGNPRIFGSTAINYFKRILTAFREKGWLMLWILKINEVPVSYVINFKYYNKIYFYNVAYDKNYSRYSPGTYLTSLIIQEAFKDSVQEFDFLRGEEAYKTLWTKNMRKLFRIGIYKKSFRSWIYFLFIVRLNCFLKKHPIFVRINQARIKYIFKIRSYLGQGKNEHFIRT